MESTWYSKFILHLKLQRNMCVLRTQFGLLKTLLKHPCLRLVLVKEINQSVNTSNVYYPRLQGYVGPTLGDGGNVGVDLSTLDAHRSNVIHPSNLLTKFLKLRWYMYITNITFLNFG